MKQILVLACLAVGLNQGDAAWAADKALVLDVWPGKAAGDHRQIGPERVRAPAEAPTKDAKWITNVTRPTISVFRPDTGDNTRVAVVICPGGGYWNLAWDKEGEEVAGRLNTMGITGVVLKYRVPRGPGDPERLPAPGPLLDAQRAIRLVRSRANEWGIDPERIGIMGFSAGGHLAVMTAISFEKPSYGPIDDVDRQSCRPNFAVVAYPGYILTRPGSGVLADYIRIPKGTGPMFLVHASDDDEPGAQPEQSLALYRALREAGVPVDLHIYDEGGHGFGVRRSRRPVSGWPERCAEWMRHRGILPAEAGQPSRTGHAQEIARFRLTPMVRAFPPQRILGIQASPGIGDQHAGSVGGIRPFHPGGTDREISAGFDRESSATQVERAMCGKVSAYANLARPR